MGKEIVGNINNLVKAVDQRIYPGDNPSELINHELAHASVHESYGGTGDFGILFVTYIQEVPKIIDETYVIWEQLFVEVVSGAFYLPDEPLEDIPPEVRMEMAQAPGITEMSGNRQWGDWAVWWQAYNELLDQERIESSTKDVSEPLEQPDMKKSDSDSEPINYWEEDTSNPYSDENNDILPQENADHEIIVDPFTPQIIYEK